MISNSECCQRCQNLFWQFLNTADDVKISEDCKIKPWPNGVPIYCKFENANLRTQTCYGWPNGITSRHKSQTMILRPTCVNLYLVAKRWETCTNLHMNLSLTKMIASHRKGMQVVAKQSCKIPQVSNLWLRLDRALKIAQKTTAMVQSNTSCIIWSFSCWVTKQVVQICESGMRNWFDVWDQYFRSTDVRLPHNAWELEGWSKMPLPTQPIREQVIWSNFYKPIFLTCWIILFPW